MVVFDTALLLFIFSIRVGAPKDPVTRKPIDRAKERVDLRLKELEKKNVKVIIPTPALAEILVHAGTAGPEQLAKISGNRAFRVVNFDQRAAVQVARLAQEKGDRPKSQTDTYAKIKYDRQIAAIAKVEGATAIYTDDESLSGYAKRLGIPVVKLGDLPLPAPPPATTPDLFADHADKDVENADQGNEAPAVSTEGRPDGEPTGAVPADGEGTGLQPEPGGVRAEAGEDREGEAAPEADVEEDELTAASVAAPPTPAPPPEAPPPPSSPEKA